MSDKNDHTVERNSETEKKEHLNKDHYHDIHHILKNGEHDDIDISDFKIGKSFKYSKRNLTFKISMTGVFIALALAASAVDIIIEMLEDLIPPINGIRVSLRILDIIIVNTSISPLGPIFASIVGISTPWIHFAIHGGAHGNPFEPLFDSISYLIMIWILWLLYFVIFKNSFFHKDANKSRDRSKRWWPIPFYVITISSIFTAFYILSVYLADLTTHRNLATIQTFDSQIDWNNMNNLLIANISIIATLNIIRFSIIYSVYALVEPMLKILNHKYK